MPGLPTITSYALPTRNTLPEQTADWTVHPERAVLLIHDMQEYFLRPLPEPLRTDLIHNTALVRKRAASQGVPVAYTAQPGRMTDQQRGLLRDFWGPGMEAENTDREVVAELAPVEGDWTLTKWRYSAFFRSDLLKRLRAAGRDQLVLCGVYAHVGVLATALDAFTNDIQPFVIADALADFSAEEHRLALHYVTQRCGMAVLAEEVFS